MRRFQRRLEERATDPASRRWLFVPYDQLTDRVGPLSREDPTKLGVVLVENRWQSRRRPYHKQKLALLLANQRQFALEQAARGVAVRYVISDEPFRHVLAPIAAQLGPLRMMEAAERELRADVEPLVAAGNLRVIPHEGWLTTRSDFLASQPPSGPWRMDAFYRRVRRRTGVLMSSDRPVGGRFSFDGENRRPWKGKPPAPEEPRFEADPITEEAARFVEAEYADHPGTVDLSTLPATDTDAETLWAWACSACLPHFGPYEDAMSRSTAGLFHTRVSPLLNILRLTPARVVADAVSLDVPLAGKEGFVRQVLGWREFMRHAHRETDGFRRPPGPSAARALPFAPLPGDGGFGRWRGWAWNGSGTPAGLDGGATPAALGGAEPLPAAFWGAESGLACLDHVVREVLGTGWTHHIPRLMVLSNIATLLDVSPRELTDWFWVAFVDAFDWVVEPNVLGMGTYALGDLLTTKPYVSGAAYIDRMGDYCSGCRFDPRSDCPVTSLYWAYLERHRDRLTDNRRLRLPLASLDRREPRRRDEDRTVFEWVRDALAAGRELQPEDRPEVTDGGDHRAAPRSELSLSLR